MRCSMSISTRVSADFDALRRFNEFLGELSCVICLEPLANPVTLACSHSFCRECILRALSVAPVCPLCKTVTARRGLKDDAFLAQLVQAAVQQREILRAQVEAHRAQPPAALRFSQQETQAPSSPAQSRRVQPRRVQAADLQASSPHLPRRLGCSALQALRPLLMRARVAPCRWRPSTSTPSRKSRTALRPCARTWQVWSRPRATTPRATRPSRASTPSFHSTERGERAALRSRRTSPRCAELAFRLAWRWQRTHLRRPRCPPHLRRACRLSAARWHLPAHHWLAAHSRRQRQQTRTGQASLA